MAAKTSTTDEVSKGSQEDMPSANGSLVKSKPRSKRRSRRTSYPVWIADKATKLLIWYSLFIVAFRCPASIKDITSDTSRICRPYLQVRQHVQPYLQPYYDGYVAPYTAIAQPYLDQLNSKVYQPATAAYSQYGASRVAQAQKFGEEQWMKTVKPQFENARQQAGKQYDTVLAPHVKKAQDVVQPHYDNLRTSVNDLWELEIEPVYRRTAPYAEKLYKQGHRFAIQTALPQAQYASNAAYAFWIRQIWPKIRVLYGENVEPQLMRITERLGRYKDEKKLEAEVKSAEISRTVATVTEATSGISSASSIAAKPSIDTRAQFLDDLESWKLACSTAAREGSEHLIERINEITEHQIASQAKGVGSARVEQLADTKDGALSSVKARILAIVAGLPEDAEDRDFEDAHESMTISVRNAGQSIKKYAQAVREWRQHYDAETSDLIQAALTSTLETIDNIRELRLTEIGRTYASSALPHKEWAKYNDLKKATQDWRDDVKGIIEKSKAITKAQEAGKEIEGQGMGIAEDAAKELARLKEVGNWKIEAQDATDDFESKTFPAVRKVRKIIEQPIAAISEAVLGETTTSLVDHAQSVVSSASQAILGTSTGSAESLLSEASSVVIGTQSGLVDTATDAASSLSSSAASAYSSIIGKNVVDDATASAASAYSSAVGKGVVDDATASIASVYSSAIGKGVVDDATSTIASASAVGQGAYDDASSSVASAYSSILGKDAVDDATSSVASIYSSVVGTSVVGDATSSIASVYSSAIGKGPVGDATSSVSSVYSSLVGEGSDAISTASASVASAYSSVVGRNVVDDVTDTVNDVVETVTSTLAYAGEEIASSASSIASGVSVRAEAVYEAASVEEVIESATRSVASASSSVSRVIGGVMAQAVPSSSGPILEDVLDDINEGIEGLKNRVQAQFVVPDAVFTDALTASAASGFDSFTKTAADQYSSAMSAASSILFKDGSSVVSEGSKAAAERYLAAVTAASYAIYGTPTSAAVVNTITSFANDAIAAANAKYSTAVSQASLHWEAAKSRVSAEISGKPKPVHEQMYSSVESAYSDALGAASSRLNEAMSLLPTTTPAAYSSISAVASSRLQEAISAASLQYQSAKIAVGAEPAPLHEQYLASAQQAYYYGLGVAYDQYSSFVDTAKTAVGVTTPGYLEAASSSYSAAIAAASQNLAGLVGSLQTAVGATTAKPHETVLAGLSSRYSSLVAVASSQLDYASSQASGVVYGTPQPPLESASSVVSSVASDVASQAVANWNALIERASSQVYGTPVPFTASVYSQAGAYAAQATLAAAQQYEAVQSIFSELVSGKDATFTDSVMARLSSAYYVGAPSAASVASSYASEAYESASSVISSVFTAPIAVDDALASVTDQLNSAVEAASIQFYGSSTGTFESATSAAASAYSDAASKASAAIYGTESGYVELATASFAIVAESASKVISEALFGTPTGNVEGVSKAAANTYSAVTKAAIENAAAASSAISSAIYGPEQGAYESAQARIAAAVESARQRIESFAIDVNSAVAATAVQASSVASSVFSEVSKAAESVTKSIKDEL